MSGRHVCFVCGSLGAESVIRIKPHNRLPYFPFLEHHDPPKGARLPSNDGAVESCRVCYAFLTQQWETYERSKTPAIKRLYWLKRADNGHFTGAEMRLQGEYIAQIMGLNYQPGADGRNSPDSSTRDGLSPIPHHKDDRESAFASRPYMNQVDESIPKQEPKSKPKLQTQNIIPHVSSKSEPLLRPNVPSTNVQSEGVLDLTVKKDSKPVSIEIEKEQLIVCFICAKNTYVSNCKYVSTMMQSTTEPFFPSLQKLERPEGAFPLNQLGQAIVCSECRATLYQQWQAYEMSGKPFMHRIYKLPSTVTKQSNHRHTANILNPVKTPQTEEYVCYLCGKLYASDLLRMLYTVPPQDPNMGSLFFPFVHELKRPKGAQPLKSDGSVLSCRNCYAELYRQWQAQEVMQIPVYQRRYSLPFIPSHNENHPEREKPVSEIKMEQDGDSKPSFEQQPVIIKPLNIQISESIEDSNGGSSSTQINQGLLAIAGESSPTVPTPSPSKLSSLLKRPLESLNSGKPNPTVPHPLEQATSIPKKICFLCGEKSLTMNTHVICSYPVRHETKGAGSQVVPFFPFLESTNPAPGADPMTDEGTVNVCTICFHTLLKQWNLYEEHTNPAESNRWLRKYSMPDFVCYLCGKSSNRKNVKMLEFSKFPCLKEHKIPPESLILNGGQVVIACRACAGSLNQQFAEYERLKVPISLRKYNWGHCGTPGEDEDHDEVIDIQGDQKHEKADVGDIDVEGDDGRPLMSSEYGKSHDHKADVGDIDVEGDDESPLMSSKYGLQQGSKPPPLTTMISPAASKLSRNTATVPPLNQVSPSNGVNSISANAALNATRTSSFAAALRKLAHQAKDPEEVPPNHSSQPGSSSTSPRAVTPKRGPPPLVYNSHSSSLTSPPVVTIAPTQAHPTISSTEAKQSLERAHSVQSTASSAYEALKQERDRPQSTHSNRDDDRISLKDMSASRSHMTPHSVHSSSPAAIRDEGIGRGFQPYRPGDDLRHQLPPSAFGLDPATAAAYSYPAAFLPPHAFPHPAFRFDDPMFLERYRMMQPPYMPFGHPGMLPPPGVHPLLASGRYPPELLHQQFPFVSQSSRLSDHISPSLSERQRMEEERYREHEREKEREKELEREKEKESILLREKERAREREKEYDKEREKSREQFYSHHLQAMSSERQNRKERSGSLSGVDHHKLPRAEELGVSRLGSITQGTPKDIHHRREIKTEKGLESHPVDRNGREYLSERSAVHLPSNIEHRREDKYSQLFTSGSKVHGDVSQDNNRYTQLHSTERSQNSSSELRPTKSDSSFFRPFDTKTLTNGYHHSGTLELEKFSSNFKHVSDHRNKTETNKSRQKDPHVNKTHNDIVNEHKHKQDKQVHRKSSGDEVKNSHHTVRPIHTTLPVHQVEHNPSRTQSEFESLSPSSVGISKSIYSDCHTFKHLFPPSGPNLSESHKPVTSRLDVEEKKLKDKRAIDPYYTESEDEEDTEELQKGKLLLVTSGPPLPLDEGSQKMRFFKNLGITSCRVKKEIEFERLRKRRHLHRERSVSPVELDNEVEKPDLVTLPIPPISVSDEICKEKDYKEKSLFLGMLHLSSVDAVRKRELEKIQNACEEERHRRLSKKRVNGRGTKRKMHLVDSLWQGSRKKRLMDSDCKNRVNLTKSLLFPHHQDRELCREFVQEFHHSVLLSTRKGQKEHSSDHKAEDLSSSTNTSCESGRGSSSHDFEIRVPRWPGVNAMIESYQIHVTEQSMELKVLKERFRMLQSQNIHLNKTAENISRKMSDMLGSKKKSEECKIQIQSAIDNLKQCIKELK